MNKGMKKLASLCLAVSLLGTVMASATTTAPEATESGIYDLQIEDNYSVTAHLAAKDGPAIDGKEVTIDGATTQIFENAERVQVTLTNTAPDQQYLVLMLKETDAAAAKDAEMPALIADNILYIDQQSGTGLQPFNVFPREMSAGAYSVWMSTSNSAAPEKVASFQVHSVYEMGDVNMDTKTNIDDAILVLRYILKKADLTGEQFNLANLVQDAGTQKVNVSDVVAILEKLVA